MWFAVQTQPSRDALARDELRKQTFAVMMPTYLKRSIQRGQVQHDPRPVFPGYLFVAFAWADRWQAICSTRGVKRLFMQPLLSPEIELIEHYCSAEVPMDVEAASLVGNLIRITDGPFAMFNGICDEVVGSVGHVTLTIFGRACRTAIPLRFIEKADES